MYTHYWKGKIDNESFIKSVKEIKFLYFKRPKVSRTAGYYYKNNRIAIENDSYLYDKNCYKSSDMFTDTLIRFNGLKRLDLNHETFTIEPNIVSDFPFCKTSRKPYDFMVCICLISLANNCKDFTFRSDGDYEDWKPAYKFYTKHFPINSHFNIKNLL